MSSIEIVLALIVAVIVVAALARLWPFRRVVLHEHQRALLYRSGRFVETLAPGAYWIVRWRDSVQLVDVRAVVATVPGQDILTSDNVSLKVSIALRYHVNDPRAAIERAQ